MRRGDYYLTECWLCGRPISHGRLCWPCREAVRIAAWRAAIVGIAIVVWIVVVLTVPE